MPKIKTDSVSAIPLIGDLFLLNFAFFSLNYLNGIILNENTLIQYLYINLFWVVSASLLKTYGPIRVKRITEVLNILFRTCFLHILLIFSFIVVLKQELKDQKLFILEYLIFIVFIVSWRIVFIYFLKVNRERGYNNTRVVIAGGGKEGRDIYDFFSNHPEYGYKCLGFFDDNIQHPNRLGTLKELEKYVLENKVYEIYCSISNIGYIKLQELISFADNNLIRLKIIPDFSSIGNYKVNITFYDNIPVLSIRDFLLESYLNRLLKRSFDIVFSFFVIITIFPWLFPIIAIAIKLSSKGPVFFRQKRSGRYNKSFVCYKFRTMTVNSLADELQATQNDNRVTSVGKFLRSKSLDELPQFWNVLIGNMSVVGPRPHMLSHTHKYSREIDKFMLRHFVKSGVTGLAQIKGLRGETKTLDQMETRVQLDIWYIENWTFYLDLNIIINTVIELFRGRYNGV